MSWATYSPHGSGLKSLYHWSFPNAANCWTRAEFRYCCSMKNATSSTFPTSRKTIPQPLRRLSGLRIPASSGLAGAALRSGRAEKVDDPQSDPRLYSGVDRKTGITTKSLLVAPLLTGDERLGVIEAVNPRGRPSFTDADLALLEKLALSIAVAVQNARRFREVKASAEQLQARVGVLRRDLARRDRFTEIIGVNAAMLELASERHHKSLRELRSLGRGPALPCRLDRERARAVKRNGARGGAGYGW